MIPVSEEHIETAINTLGRLAEGKDSVGLETVNPQTQLEAAATILQYAYTNSMEAKAHV